MLQGKWFKNQIWYRYINKNHHLSDYSLIDGMMLHRAVSYDPTLWHVYLYGKVNGEGFYRHFVTINNTSTLHCYYVWKKGEAGNYHKVKTVCFYSKRLYDPFTQNLVLEAQFESSDDESYTKDDNTTNLNIK